MKKAAIHSSTTKVDNKKLRSAASDRTRWVKWLLFLAVILLGIYRLATFVPQPLDSPATLRAVLYPWYAAFVRRYPSPAQAMSAWRTFGLWALFVPVILALLNYLWHSSILKVKPPERVRRILESRSLLWAAITGCLVLWRYPILLLNELNPDETQFIVSACKLFRDPLFFRSVDCGTSGPLNIYPLMLPALFGFSPDYAASRLVALVIILLSIYTLYRAFALLIPDHLARIALLPLAGIFSLLNSADFVHYSSEHVSLLLLSLGIYSCFRLFRDGQMYVIPMGILGLLTTCAFFAKMQAVPLLVAVDAVGLAYVHATVRPKLFWRPAAVLLAGAAPLPLIVAAVCVAAGQWENFWITYILGNRRYVNGGYGGGRVSYLPDFVHYVLSPTEIRVFIFTALAMLAAYLYWSPRSRLPAETVTFVRMAGLSLIVLAACTFLRSQAIDYYYLAIGIFFVMLAFVFLLCKQNMPRAQPRLWAAVLAASLLVSAFAAIYITHRFFPHYLLMLIIPFGVVMAYFLTPRADGGGMSPAGGNEAPIAGHSSEQSSELSFVLIFIALCLTFYTYLALTPLDNGFGFPSATLRVPESDYISSVTPPGQEIVAWGWNSRPYLGAGRDPATRDTNMANFFLSTEATKAYYRERFVRDLQSHPAVLFIDAVASSCCSFVRREDFGFELIPDIKSFIQSHYVYVMSAYSERFYIRRDLAFQVAGIGPSKPCAADAIRCFDHAARENGIDIETPFTLPAIQMPHHALIETAFTPETNQDLYATVFSNEATQGSGQGFQLQHLGNDEYTLAIGLGEGRWAFSKSMTLPQRKQAVVAVEVNPSTVTIVLNGRKFDEMHLSHSLVDSPGAIVLGSWIGEQRPFKGNIQSFQIRDLAKDR
ncbi:MAG TPA: hypothetical protein VKG25_03180 [Bryobacteraceae bacterium]|nr:hypothetical protein [Bryobacteraceae bacterium]